MSMNLNLGIRAIGALSYFLLLAFTGGAGTGEITFDGVPFLLAMALCGSVTGVLGAALVQKMEQAVRNAQRRRFAAAASTAIPTVAVRLSSSEATNPQPLIFSYHTPAAQPLVHV